MTELIPQTYPEMMRERLVFEFVRQGATDVEKIKEDAENLIKYIKDGATEADEQYVKAGKSQTMNSKHIKGLAVDLWALPDSKTVSWENQHYYVIADAMLAAAKELGVTITWGAAWGRYLNNYGSAKSAQEAYLSDRKKVGKKPFIDAVHFELP